MRWVLAALAFIALTIARCNRRTISSDVSAVVKRPCQWVVPMPAKPASDIPF